MPDWIIILFLFALGACVGSFLNVVVWRLPRVEMVEGEGAIQSFFRGLQALSYPPSHCPRCEKPLRWYDNLPVIGWLKLRGKCRYCREPISPRYPIVEGLTGLLFAFYYVMFFHVGIGPCGIARVSFHEYWPMYFLYMALVAGLLAASLIDGELFIIPLEIPYVLLVLGVATHALVGRPGVPGALLVNAETAAIAGGALLGLGLSFVLWSIGVIPSSFPRGEPMLEVDRAAMLEEVEAARRAGKAPGPELEVPPAYTPGAIRAEMSKEMLFLLPPLLLGIAGWLAVTRMPSAGRVWATMAGHDWFSAAMGSMLGAMVGAFVVWIVRILGTLGFGRVAMGLGDVHLMFGVGAVVGAGAATVAFFLAPFFGILTAMYMLITGTRRELPYGPYLSMATAAGLLFYCDVAGYFAPGLGALVEIVSQWLH